MIQQKQVNVTEVEVSVKIGQWQRLRSISHYPSSLKLYITLIWTQTSDFINLITLVCKPLGVISY